jgi:hypothetical protein
LFPPPSKTYKHDITEILLKVALNTISLYLRAVDHGICSYKIQDMTRINCRTNEGMTKCLKFTSKLGEKKDDSSVDRVLVQSVKTNSRQPLNDVTARFNARTGCGMS